MVFRFWLFTFVPMNKKYSIVGLLFGLMLLFAIVVQSADSIHHLEKALTEKKCFHKVTANKAEITHGHHALDHCFVCEKYFWGLVLICCLLLGGERR